MSRWIRNGQYLLGFLLFLLLWWGGSLLVGPAVLPSPADVASYLADPGILADFFGQIALTAGRGVLGFSAAWMVAFPAGLLMGRHPASERMGFLPVFLLQSAPPLFWVTPLVLWLGTRGAVAPVVAFLVSLPLLTVHITNAVRAIPEHKYDVFSVYAPARSVIARELYLPHLLPAMKSNIHLGLLVAIKASMLAEWFAAQDGFGRTIRLHYQFFAMTEFLAWALLFLLVVGGLSLLIRWSLEKLLPAYRSTDWPPGLAEGSELGDNRSLPDSIDDGIRPFRVSNLSFGYGRRPLFRGLNLTVSPDRPLIISGESGCGKTTLLRCLAGLVTPWSGQVDRDRPVGLVFQDDALLSHRDALGNVLLPALPVRDTQVLLQARAALDQWGLGSSGGKFPHQLSGGMRKRLSMAREWFRGSSVLLLDEPFVNLDREAREALWALLFERVAERRIPTVIVTHYPEETVGYPVDGVTRFDMHHPAG